MARPSSDISKAVRRHARKRTSHDALILLLWLAVPAALVAGFLGALALAGRMTAGWTPVVLVSLAGALGIAYLVTMLRPVAELGEAKRLDDELKLKDRLTSALAFLARPRRTAFEEKTIADAADRLDLVAVHAGAQRSLRPPAIACAVAGVIACSAITVATALRGTLPAPRDRQIARVDRKGMSPVGPEASNLTNETEKTLPTSDEGLVKLEDTTLEDEALAPSTWDEAALAAMDALAAGDTGEADRLLAQAAYLNESDLSDSGDAGGRTNSGEDVMTMKEPDMDMIRDMVKQAQERRKKGEDSGDSGDDINLEVLIKSRSTPASKQPDRRQSGGKSSGGGGGPSQDTRIKPKRVEVARKVEFKITSMRSLTPPTDPDVKRIALNEAIMRTSGVPQPPLVEPRQVAMTDLADAPRTIEAQGVPADLRAYVSRYFEGLKDLSEKP